MSTTKKKTTAKKPRAPRKKSPVYVSDLMKGPANGAPPPPAPERGGNEDAYEFVSQGYRSLSRNLLQLLPALRKDPVGTLQDLQIRAIAFVSKRLPARKANVDGKPDYRHLRREWLKRRIQGRFRKKSD